MRVPIPERFGTRPAIIFALSLFVGQILVGTDIVFAFLTLVYVALFVLGFNAAGGLLYPSGAFIFFNGILTAILGLTYKVFLLEPGQDTLLSGDKSMLCYCGGMFSMAIAAALSRRLRPKRGLLAGIAAGEMMKRAALGCLVLGVAITVLTWGGASGSSVGSALRQINHFVPLAILLGATYEIQRSEGRKGANWIVYLAIFFLFAQGVIGFSKEGMLVGPITWLIVAVALGYDFSRRQIFFLALGAFFIVYYLVPYSQYVRVYRTGSTSGDAAVALKYLGNLNETRTLYYQTLEVHDATGEPHLYSTQQGFFDRLNMLAFDDALINYTDQGNVYGLLPTFYSYANILPHFIWKDKPFFAFGNNYGREIGAIDEDDVETGISFSATGDAYHEATWFGLLAVWPVVAFIFFFINDSLTGSARHAPWALLPITLSAHIAPEGMMSGVIFLSTYGVLALLFAVWFVQYALPALSRMVSGGRSDPGQAPPDFRPRLNLGPLHPVIPLNGRNLTS